MTRALLDDGSIVELSKECRCITHDGPHWLHMDRLDRERNREYLAAGGMLGIQAFLQGEQRRLDDKMRNMRAMRIVEIIKEPGEAGGS